jgi:hypothetical protein
VFILLLGVGVLLRWRWTFWLITVAFLAGVLRAPAAVLQLTGILTADAPTWYLVFQGLLGHGTCSRRQQLSHDSDRSTSQW